MVSRESVPVRDRALGGSCSTLVSRYIEPRNADGTFLPAYSDSSKIGFVEGNAMQYTWSVPYDVGGVVRAIGPAAAKSRLDAMLSRLNTDRYAPYAWLGNEPSFGMPWLYLWLQSPAKTQSTVRRATTTLFRPTPAGLPGDDDLGAMSAWYVWSSLGLYPAIPGVGGLAIGSPTFDLATIHAGSTYDFDRCGRTRAVRSRPRGKRNALLEHVAHSATARTPRPPLRPCHDATGVGKWQVGSTTIIRRQRMTMPRLDARARSGARELFLTVIRVAFAQRPCRKPRARWDDMPRHG